MTSRFKVLIQCTLFLGVAILARPRGPYSVLAQVGPSVPRISFTKLLKGSSPEYVALSLDVNGKGVYDSWNAEGSSNPHPIQISAQTTSKIFSLAKSLNNFRSLELESRHKVANMGLKTFTFEDGKEVNKVQYNYSENRTAQQLTETFEKIADVEEAIAQLQFAMKYDHLNLPQILSQIQGQLAEHNLVEAELLIPTLEKIANNPRFMHLAKARAQEIMLDVQAHK